MSELLTTGSKGLFCNVCSTFKIVLSVILFSLDNSLGLFTISVFSTMETGDFCSKGLMVLSTNRLLLPNSFGASFVLIFISDFSTTGATGFC